METTNNNLNNVFKIKNLKCELFKNSSFSILGSNLLNKIYVRKRRPNKQGHKLQLVSPKDLSPDYGTVSGLGRTCIAPDLYSKLQ